MALVFFCFDVHEADSDEHVVILQGNIQKSRLVLREPRQRRRYVHVPGGISLERWMRTSEGTRLQ